MSEDRMENRLTGQEVAVIGMAGRFPGAASVEQLWSNVSAMVEAIHFFTEDELKEAGVSSELLARPEYVRAHGLLAGADRFDAAFFGFSPREAEATDPQYRLFLECAWEALENAGYDPQTYPGAVGVYAGAGFSSYAVNVYSHPEVLEAMTPMQVGLALDKDYLATRVSYKLGLRGPSLSVQTACSTSLVCVHLACQALLAGECDMALAGGVSVPGSLGTGYLYHEGGIHSPDGHCRAFDARARGTVTGSGLGIVVLKRLEDALEDGDRIYAVIRGSAINNDGDLKVGYTAPSVEGQAQVIRAALELAEVPPETVGYVEAHGTGTPLGDPVEITALTRAFRASSERRGWCAVSSIKTNVGHLDTAAGVTGLIKAVLALDRKMLPPSLHFEEPNPQIDFASSPFFVNTRLTPWETDGVPRRAGVSSFGIGGTNAHVVLEEAPPTEPGEPAGEWQVLVLSARSGAALEQATDNLAAHLDSHPEGDLADIAYTLQVGRTAFEHRRIAVCRSREEARELLATRDSRRVLTRHQKQLVERPLAFLFPGQGTQRPHMLRELSASEPVIAHWIDRCSELLRPHLGLDLRSLLDPGEHEMEEAARRLSETDIAQPALFVVEYALAQLWMKWVGEPEVTLGHSLGEYVAACLAGVFSLEEALRLVAIRGRLMQGCAQGAMLAVELSPDELAPLLGRGLSLAAVNGPQRSVLSGDEDAISAAERELASRGVQHRRLRTSRAFHSPMMEPILEAFEVELRRIQLRPPRLPFLSNLTGTFIRDEEATDAGYWVRHLRHTVRFSDCLATLWQESSRILLEVGPGAALTALARRHPARPESGLAVASLDARNDAEGAAPAEPELLLTALGRLWLAGAEVRWKDVHAAARRQRIPLPTYPFERQRYWLARSPRLDVAAPARASAEAQPVAPREALASAGYSRPELETSYEAPRNDDERAVAECWELLLGIQPLGIHDDFFALGGDSLLAGNMAMRLRERFDLDLPLSDLLALPTVAGAAAVVEEARRKGTQAASGQLLPTLVPDPESWYEPFPLSDVQQAYWVGRSGALELGNVATHVYEEIDCVDLDIPRLNRALCKVIDRQPMLRAIVLPDGRQQVLPKVEPYRIEVLDLVGRPPAEAEEELARLRQRMSHQVLPSDRWPLFEVRASRLDERKIRLHWSFDLLLGDAWSFALLFTDLSRLYRDPELELTPLVVSQRDYILAELDLRKSELYQRCVRYWHDRLATLPPAPELPLARRLGEIEQPRFTRRRLGLDEPTWTQLKARAGQVGVTPSGLLLAVFGEVLAVWSKRPRFTLNLTLFNRLPLHPQINELVGDFTSLLLLEVDASGDDPFEARAQRLQRRLWEDLDHRYFSGIQVLRELARVRSGAGQVVMPFVFTSVLGLRPPEAEEEMAMDGGAALSGEIVYSISQTPQVLFDFQVLEVNGGLACNWDVVDEAFPAGLVDAMLDATRRFLTRLAVEEEAWERPVRGLLPAEQIELFQAVNATSRPLLRQTLDGLFAGQAAQRPQQPAVLAPDRTLTYAELDRRSYRLACHLQRLGAHPNHLVAVVLPKGWRQVVAVLAIARSGAAYLPIDPALPVERVRYLLVEGQVEIALCDGPTDAAIDWPADLRRVWIEEEEPGEEGGVETLATAHGPDDLAYVIFTSGSTGQPKGVMIEHAAAVNTVIDINERFAVGPEDRVLALSSLSFDLSVYDVFGLLAVGGALVLPEPEAAREPSRWLELIERHRVTLWNTVPALLQMLVEHVADRRGLLAPCLRLAMLSGDWIPLALPDRFKALVEGVQVVSLGGATEASIWSIVFPIDRVDPAWPSIPYGLPLVNQTWDVLDHRLAPRPVWVPGELYIGGVGLARGYWRDEEKTRLRFLDDPGSGRRLYRTGDLGRYLADGTIEFLGREDLQVKVQGHRIELGEIEAALEQHPEVLQAVVVVLGDPRAERRLAACVVAAGGAAVEEGLVSSLRRKLPAYMVPADWLFLETLPLTANGKVDRQALVRLAADRRSEARGGLQRPLTPAEETLAGMFCELLGRESLEVDEDFFGAGGDSLKATQLASRVREVFGVELPLRQIFLAPTVEELAAVLFGQSSGEGVLPGVPPLARVPRKREMPLSFAQQRLWFIDQLEPGNTLYNIPVALRIAGPLRPEVLTLALGEIVRRHETLRTAFAAQEGSPIQVIQPVEPFKLSLVDLSVLPESAREEKALALAHEEAARPFDLAGGRLLRCVLLRLTESEHVAALTMHHIVSDGWSMGLLVREISALYTAFDDSRPSPLPELPVQYADFAVWQTSWLQGKVLENEISHWRRQLAGVPTLLELPTDRPRPAVQSYRGAERPVRLSAGLTRQAEALGRCEGATLFMVLLAGFQALLARYSNQQDLAVGSPLAGRNRVEIEGLIGFFVNTLVLRGDLSGTPTFRELLGRVRETALNAYAHQDVPFEKLVEELKPERSLAHTPLFQVMFALQNAPFESLEIRDLRLQQVRGIGTLAKFDLTLNLAEHDGALSGTIEHSTDLFDTATIDRLIGHLERLLTAAAATPDLIVAELPLLSPGEANQVVAEWNDTRVHRSPDLLLHRLVAAQVERTPDAEAVVAEHDGVTQRITYRELAQRADRLARHLCALGVGADVPVGVFAERSVEMVVALLGILEAGGAYVPLDPGYPADRLAFMAREARMPVILTQGHLRAAVPDAGAAVVLLDQELERGGLVGWTPRAEPAGENLAYVIFTSGSTGQPKGAMLPHAGICNRILWMQEAYGLSLGDRVLQKTPFSFDVSVWEFFWPLLTGATLVMARPGGHQDPAYLSKIIESEAITTLHFVPSMLQAFLAQEDIGTCSSLRRVMLSGEALSEDLRRRFYERLPSVEMHNLYGPTEASVDVTFWACPRENERGLVPIGRPIANTRIYLVDPAFRPVPPGVAGELVIGGVSLARGYLGRPDLTGGRFVPDPFAEQPGERLYRTGDLARHLPDGTIEYLGRIDHQVKLRGFRIELGEIEAALATLEGVRQAVVTLREDTPGDRRLVAYVAGDLSRMAVDRMRGALRERLPEYMVPAAFVTLTNLPLTANGKVDRKALPAPERPQTGTDGFAAPRNILEQKIAEVWQEVLGLDRVGRDDNFFDAGGHSLLMIQVRARLRKELGRDLTVIELFQYPTVRSLAEHLGKGRVLLPTPPVVRVEPSTSGFAVIGMAGRFPGAADIETLWANLREGREAVVSFTDEELREAGVSPEMLAHPRYVKAGPVLEGIELFDAEFFGFSPREAEMLDPQHRLFLEASWQALEDAGYDPRNAPGHVGVWAGADMSTYAFHLLARPDLLQTAGHWATQLGIDKDYLATRVSYELNLEGPSVVVQTACSTSLVAVHHACRSLASGECDTALAGGVHVRAAQKTGYLFEEGSINSPDGHCRAFDAKAGGTFSGSGVGVVVLKRLEDALRDGDTIHAVIRGTAINNDGSLKVGFTAPSVNGQAKVIAAAQAAAGVSPAMISYIEAHGTGTPLGDPIEITALTQAFDVSGTGTQQTGYCGLGSIKTNIGHLGAAAGVAGLIKTVLALKHRQIPPSLHFETPNPAIDLASSPFRVINRLTDWATDGGGPRRAGVSSFGIGGTNAHAVLEEAPPAEPSGASRPLQLLLLSARTPAALEEATSQLAAWLERHAEVPLADVAHTLRRGRHAFEHRRMLVCASREDALTALEVRDPERLSTRRRESDPPAVAWLLPGQGSQHPGMGRDLYETEPVFCREIDACADSLALRLGRDLREILFSSSGAELAETRLAQPALFAVEYALSRLWLSWGLRPQALLGHSLGEYVAACLSGVLSVDDALTLVAARGELMQELPPGAMLSVDLSEAEALAEIAAAPGLSLAAVNSPGQCVISGPVEEIDALAERLARRAAPCRRLHTSHAFHSKMMEPILDRFAAIVARVELRPPSIPYLSNLTGTWITAAEATDPRYWTRHLRETVRFGDGVSRLLAELPPGAVLLEVGPGKALGRLARRHAAGRTVLASMPHPGSPESGAEALLHAVGRLWLAGVEIDWQAFQGEEKRHRVPLPTYPFQRQRFWVDAPRPGSVAGPAVVDPRRFGLVGGGEAVSAADLGGHLRNPRNAELLQRLLAEEPDLRVLLPLPTEAGAASEPLVPFASSKPGAGHRRPDLATPYREPQGELEQRLATIWGDLLGIDQVGAHDDFFELGGHSLLATRLISRLREDLGCEIPLETIFAAPSVARLAARLEAGGGLPAPRVAPIVPVPRTGDLPLSFAQQRLWFLDQLEPGSPLYNMPVALRVEGPLRPEVLAPTLGEIVRRHETLRTVFAAPEGSPVQVIQPAVPFRLPVVDLSELPESEREALALTLTCEEAVRPFDLARGPLLRGVLLRLAESDHVVALNMHHIASDRWSIGILVHEIAALYPAFATGRPSPLPELPVQYADFAVWQSSWLQGEILEQEMAFWRRQLAGLPPLLELPTDRPRPAVQRFRGATRPVRLPADLIRQLETLGRSGEATLFMVLLAVFQALLGRYSGQQDLAVGTPIAGRKRVEIEGLIGFFVNTLVLRGDLAGEPSFRELLGRVREVALAAYLHQDVPFERLVQELAPERSLAHTPLFQVMLVLQNTPGETMEIQDLHLRPVSEAGTTAKFDLTLTLEEHNGELRGSVGYATDLFDAATIDHLILHFERLLAAATSTPELPVSALPLLSEAELRELVREAPEGARSLSTPGCCVHELFAEQAVRTPAALAVVDEEGEWTYAELGRRARQLALRLCDAGVGPDQPVLLCAERGAGLVAGLLGILEAGGAYLTVEPDLPQARLELLAQDAHVRVAVTERRLDGALPAGLQRVFLDAEDLENQDRPVRSMPPVLVTPGHLAYVLYTSGSTGQPKGVMVEHRQLTAYVLGVLERLTPPSGASFATVSSFSADLGNTSIFAALLGGGCLHVIGRERLADADAFAERMERRPVDVLKIVPSHLAALLMAERPERSLPRHRLVLGGEPLPWSLVDRVRALAPECRLFNHYGPTETTVGVLAGAVETDTVRANASAPLGRPLGSTRAWVVDRHLQLVPAGLPGELCVGGPQVARGYLGRPDLTAERFIPDPFSGGAGERLYRTGDLVRRRSDGPIEFLGRIDAQVKIRGFRIELGEIEAALVALPGIREAVVLARENRSERGLGDRRLVAYVVGDVAVEELRRSLRERLPDYMVPAVFVPLSALPLTPNGKVDRKALPDPEWQVAEEGFLAPRTPVEEVLVGLWTEILGNPRIGIDDDFFALGGHSLLATQMVAALRSACEVEISVRDLFDAPTPRALADRVERSRSEGRGLKLPPIVPAPRDRELPLSLDQRRLWFLDQLEPGNPFYNRSDAVRCRGPLDLPILTRCFEELVQRHEILRTVFPEVGGQPVQVVSPAAPLQLPRIDLEGLPVGRREEEARRLIAAELRVPFELSRGPLLRARVFRLSPEEHIVGLCMHHIIWDGGSTGVLVRDLVALYRAFAAGQSSPLAPLPVQYADFACWQQEHLQGDLLAEQLAYWRRQLAGIPPRLELITDRPRPEVQGFRGSDVQIDLPADLVTELRTFSRRHSSTLFMTLLAAFNVLLYARSGSADIVVSVPAGNRGRPELEPLIGFFVNMLALRTRISAETRFTDLLKEVRKTSLDALDHVHVPFDRVVNSLRLPRDLAYNTLTQVSFVLGSGPSPQDEMPDLVWTRMEVATGTVQYELNLSLREIGGGLSGVLEYSTELFDRSTAVRMASGLEVILRNIVKRPDIPVQELEEMLAEGARQDLVAAGLQQLQRARRRVASAPASN